MHVRYATKPNLFIRDARKFYSDKIRKENLEPPTPQMGSSALDACGMGSCWLA